MNMNSRSDRGGRWGWIGGFAGGTLWILPLAGLLFFKGDPLGGAVGLCLWAACFGLAIVLRPWRWPQTPISLLYLTVLLAVCGAALFFGLRYDLFRQAAGRPGWMYFLWMPACFIPVFTLGRKRWGDIHGGEAAS